MTKRMKFILLSPLFVTGFLLLIALGGKIVQELWNWLLPPLFGFPTLTFWQALGLLALSRILVGGFGMRGDSRECRHDRHRLADRIADRLADRVAERYGQMTPEQRERFRQRLRERGLDSLASQPRSGESP